MIESSGYSRGFGSRIPAFENKKIRSSNTSSSRKIEKSWRKFTVAQPLQKCERKSQSPKHKILLLNSHRCSDYWSEYRKISRGHKIKKSETPVFDKIQKAVSNQIQNAVFNKIQTLSSKKSKTPFSKKSKTSCYKISSPQIVRREPRKIAGSIKGHRTKAITVSRKRALP